MYNYDFDDLKEWDDKICKLGKKNGLDWFPISYEVVDYYTMIGHMAYHGLPTHYGHWSYGKSFERTHQMYNLGMEGLPYEMIINSSPSIAYLMRENPLSMQILIMAHCIGHSDFFKNNRMFVNTRPESIIARMRNAKKRIQSYTEDPTIGIELVEEALDAAQSISFQTYRYGQHRSTKKELIEKYTQLIKDDEDGDYEDFDITKKPLEPDYDLLGFIAENGNLPEWKRDILEIVRDEAKYFIPQMQTKIINEGWACVTGDTLIDTNLGLIRADKLVATKFDGALFDGKNDQLVTNWFHNRNKKRIKIITDKGFVLHGGFNHKILRRNNDWVELNELEVGDELAWQGGNNIWPLRYQKLGNDYEFRKNKEDIFRENGVTGYLYYKVLNNDRTIRSCNSEKVSQILPLIEANSLLHKKPDDVIFPKHLNEEIATLLGLLISDGSFGVYNNRLKGGITSGDFEVVELCNRIFENNFGVLPICKKEENKWRINIPRDVISDWLVKEFDLCLGKSAHIKEIPKKILCSPKNVVEAFLRGLFDGDGYAGDNDVIYTTVSKKLSTNLQDTLTKMGIFSIKKFSKARNDNHHDGYQIRISGFDMIKFREQIGFNLARKQNKLINYKPKFERKNQKTLKVVSIIEDVGDTFDFTVSNSHQYLSSGFINHNCFNHYNICHELNLDAGLHLPILKSHNQVIRPHIGGLNPYHMGFTIFKDIEKRLGYKECLRARETTHDVSFIRQYLTQELCEDLGLFSYSEKRKDGITIDDIYDEDGWKIVKEDLISNVGTNSMPVIYVDEIDCGQLILRHEHDGRDLELDYADNVIRHVNILWPDGARLFTILEEELWEI